MPQRQFRAPRLKGARAAPSAARHGLQLGDGAAEAFLAQRVHAVAITTGITDQQAMCTYLTDDAINRLVRVLADGAARLQAINNAASPRLLPIVEAARVTAALGQVACWATTNTGADPWHAAAVAETAATMVTQWAITIARAAPTDGVVLVAADTATRTRIALQTLADKLANGEWNTPSDGTGPDDQRRANHRLRDAIIADLALLT